MSPKPKQPIETNPREFWLSLKNTAVFFSAELRARKRAVLIFIMFTVGASLVQLVSPIFTQKLIDVAIPEKNAALIGRYALVIAASVLVSYFLSLVYVRYAVRLYQDVVAAIREKVVGRLLAKDPAFFGRFSAADILTRFASDLDEVGEFFYLTFLYTFFIYSAAALGYIAWLFFMSFPLAVVSVLFFAASTALSYFYYLPVSRREMKARKLASRVNDQVLDAIEGQKDIFLFQQRQKILDRFREANTARCQAQTAATYLRDAVWISFVHLLRLNAAVPLLAGGFMVYFGVGNMTIGVLVAFIQVLLGSTEYVRNIAYALIDNSGISASIRRVDEILKSHPERDDPPMALEQTPESAEIEFRNVAFSYPGGRPVFKSLNLKIEAGERVAVTAPSGFGKTTLADLLLKVREPDAGEILFGGAEIRLYPKRFYLSHFSYVGPQTHLFNLSLKENIEMGWISADEDRLEGLLRTLRLWDMIRNLPQGLHTVIRRGGLNLSEGQRQRVALGRALIREPQVLVLDEFSAALDRETEQLILTDLLSLVDQQTIICITHSPAVAERMDRVIRLPEAAG